MLYLKAKVINPGVFLSTANDAEVFYQITMFLSIMYHVAIQVNNDGFYIRKDLMIVCTKCDDGTMESIITNALVESITYCQKPF